MEGPGWWGEASPGYLALLPKQCLEVGPRWRWWQSWVATGEPLEVWLPHSGLWAGGDLAGDSVHDHRCQEWVH